jgi:hypothetical protein
MRKFLLLYLFLALVTVVGGADLNYTGPNYVAGTYSSTPGYFRMANNSALDVTMTAVTGLTSGRLTAALPTTNWVVPAYTTVDVPVTVTWTQASTDGGNITGANIGGSPNQLIARNVATSANYGGGYYSRTVAYVLSGTTARNCSSTGVLFGSATIATGGPFGRITVNANAAAAGSRTMTIGGGTATSITLVSGANLVLNSTTPASYADGSAVLIKQGSATIGSGTIVKDASGNFNLAITATGIATQGTLTVTWPAYLNGQTMQIQEGVGTPYNVTLNGASYVGSYVPHSALANGTTIVGRINGKVVGSGVVVYNPENWAINMVLQGSTDLTQNANEALFVLDLASYNTSPLVLTLEVDGVSYSVGNVVGDVNNGVRTQQLYRIANPTGLLNGKKYAWKITGVDGSNIYQAVTIASGITPAKITSDGASYAASYGFRVDNSGTINGNAPNPQAANTYDPSAPPVSPPGSSPEVVAAEVKRVADKKDSYEAVNKAVGDAVNKSNVGDAAAPGVGQGTAGGALAASSSKVAMGAVEAAISGIGASQYVPVGTWSGVSALAITLPGAGTIHLDSTDYGIAPAVLRAVVLMGLLWMYYKMILIMFRQSMAG